MITTIVVFICSGSCACARCLWTHAICCRVCVCVVVVVVVVVVDVVVVELLPHACGIHGHAYVRWMGGSLCVMPCTHSVDG